MLHKKLLVQGQLHHSVTWEKWSARDLQWTQTFFCLPLAILLWTKMNNVKTYWNIEKWSHAKHIYLTLASKEFAWGQRRHWPPALAAALRGRTRSRANKQSEQSENTQKYRKWNKKIKGAAGIFPTGYKEAAYCSHRIQMHLVVPTGTWYMKSRCILLLTSKSA